MKLRNHSGRTRRLSLTGYWELVLGEWRHAQPMHIVTEKDPHTGALFARNPYCAKVPEPDRRSAAVSEPSARVTGNRTEFIGRNGSLAARRRCAAGLSGEDGRGARSVRGALRPRSSSPDGQEREIVFLLGASRDADEARRLRQRTSARRRRGRRLEAVWEHWNRTARARSTSRRPIRRSTCSPTAGWSTRRSPAGSGAAAAITSPAAPTVSATSLQDTMALLHASPWLAREQILLLRGTPVPRGGRPALVASADGTRRAHALLRRLSLAAVRHLPLRQATGDTGVLDEQRAVPRGPAPSIPEEDACYDLPQRSERNGDSLRALRARHHTGCASACTACR